MKTNTRTIKLDQLSLSDGNRHISLFTHFQRITVHVDEPERHVMHEFTFDQLFELLANAQSDPFESTDRP